MPRISDNIIKLGIGLTFISIVIWTIKGHSIVVGDWDLISNSYIMLFPWLFFTGIAIIYIFGQRNIPFINNILIASMIGVGFAGLTGLMYTNNIWFDTVIVGDNLLWEIQLLIIVIWVIVGIIKAAAQDESTG